MKHALLRTLLLPVLVISVRGMVRAQTESAASEARPNVVLGGGSGSPGEAIVVPIYYTAPDRVEIASLKLEISFVSVNLKYEKIESGIAAELGNVIVKGDLAVSKNEAGVETSTVTVSAAAPENEDPKPIPSGLLAYLRLEISPEGKPASIALRTNVEAKGLKGDVRLDNVRAAGTTVEVIAPGSEPAVSCFFFTH